MTIVKISFHAYNFQVNVKVKAITLVKKLHYGKFYLEQNLQLYSLTTIHFS